MISGDRQMPSASNSGKYKSLFSNTIAFTISNFASKVLVFLLIPLYTSVLTTGEYGIADLITNTINVLYPVLTLAIMEAALRFAFDSDLSRDEVLCNSIFVILISEALICLAFPLVKIVSQTLYDYWIWFAVIFFGHNLHQVLAQYAKGIGKTKVFAVSGVVQTAVIILSNIIGLLLLKLGLQAYLFSIAAGYFVTVLYLVIAARIRVKKIRVNRQLLKEMLRFSIPMIPNMVAWWVSTSADKYIIIGYLGISISGIYSASYKIPSIMTMFTSIFTSAWTISAIENVDDKENEKFHQTVYDLFNAANVLVCAVLILLSQFLAGFLFQKDFYTAWHCVPLLLVAYVFAGLSGFMSSSFLAIKYTKGLLSSSLIGAAANIVLNLFFVKQFGIMGAAFTTMAGFAITFYIRHRAFVKLIGVKINLIRDSVIYLLLAVDALLIGYEVKYAYVFGVLCAVAILVAYRKLIVEMMQKAIRIAKRVFKRG